MGGLSRRAEAVKRYEKKLANKPLLVDSGNILFKNRQTELTDKELKTADLIIDAYRIMNYTAVAVGPADLRLGVDTLINQANDPANPTPWISANIVDESNQPLFKPWIINRVGEDNIGVIGLTRVVPSPAAGISISSWQSVLPASVEELSRKSDFIVLLSNFTHEENIKIADMFPQIQLIIGATTQIGNREPTLQNNSIITQLVKQGKYLGKVQVTFDAEFPVWNEVTDKEDIYTQLGVTAPSQNTGAAYTYRFIPLPLSKPENQEVKSLIDSL